MTNTPAGRACANPRAAPASCAAGPRPVRLSVEFGNSVANSQRSKDEADVSAFVKRLAGLTDHPISMSRSRTNFHVLIMGKDDSAQLETRLRQLMPGAQNSTIRLFTNPPRDIHCLVAAFSESDNDNSYRQAVALVRAEHPDLLRKSCFHEELAQGLGLANDSPNARPSIFNDDDEFALLTTHDEALLSMLYDPAPLRGHDPRTGPPRHRNLWPAKKRDAYTDPKRRPDPMGIFDFLTGEFIDVIHWVDDTRDTMVWRFEREGHEIKYGAKLTVREGQAAVFVHEGQLADVFTPGLYMLETNNMPILTTLNHWDHGFQIALQIRDLLRQHHPLQRSQMGHQEPDHRPRPRVRPGPSARLWHLLDPRRGPGSLPDRDRRHRW